MVSIAGQWLSSENKYVKAAVTAVEAQLDKVGQRLPMQCTTVLKADYRPELDVSAELNAERRDSLLSRTDWSFEMGD
jgi:hypothetical protein